MNPIDRQTAIDLLDNLIGMVEDNHGSDYDAALRMGIEALKAEEPNLQQSCNQLATDTISRQAAIEAMRKYEVDIPQYAPREVDIFWDDAIDACCDAVEALPSAEPVRCKDCKHYVVHTLFDHSQGWCERLCDEFDKSLARGTEEDDFCSRAEKKTDE